MRSALQFLGLTALALLLGAAYAAAWLLRLLARVAGAAWCHFVWPQERQSLRGFCTLSNR